MPGDFMTDEIRVSDDPIIAADSIGGRWYQRVKVNWGANDAANDVSAANPLPVSVATSIDGTARTRIAGSGADNADVVPSASAYDSLATSIVDVDGEPLHFAAPRVLTVSPTLDTSVYASGDSMVTSVIQFTSASVDSDGTGHILSASFIDKSDQGIDMSLMLFSGSVTPAAANAAHSLSDADAEKIVGVINTSSSTWEDHLNNRTCIVRPSPPIPYQCVGGTTLYGVLVSRGAGTYASNGLMLRLFVLVD
jgi:hypothetical protein